MIFMIMMVIWAVVAGAAGVAWWAMRARAPEKEMGGINWVDTKQNHHK
jgi:hypothetical protein